MANGGYEGVLKFLSVFAEGPDGFIGFTKADRSQDPEDNKRWGQFANWYAECAGGDVDLPIETLSENPRWEYYFTPAVLSSQSRLQTKFLHSNCVWIDFDEPVDWQTFDPAPSVVVQTSEKKFHCYWLLNWRITNANDMRYWCKRFLTHFGHGDESGFDATQLLKLPWGLNLKIGSRNEDGTPWAPQVIKFEADLRYSETAFSMMPEPVMSLPDAVDMTALPDIPETVGGWSYYLEQHKHKLSKKLIEGLRTVQDGGDEKRSGVLYHLTCELFDVLGSPEEVFHILLGSPNDKFTADHGSRGSSLLWKDVNRVAAKKQKSKANPALAVALRDIMEDKALSPSQKVVETTQYVMDSLRETGDFVQTSLGECFYIDQRSEAVRLHMVNVERTSPFCGMIRRRFGLNEGAHKSSLTGILHDAVTECQLELQVTFHHFSHYDIFRNKVYVDRYDGYMYVLDGENIELFPHGYDKVYFYQTDNNQFPRPFEYTEEYDEGGLDALILDGPNFTTQGNKISRKELRHMLKTWVASYFFPEKMDTKPIVLIHGAADSGKTTLFQNLSVMFTGDSTYSVTEIPKEAKEFNVQVTQSPYIFYDNVEVNKKELQEKLAQVATGYTVKMRKLFTTNEMVSVKARSFVGITSRTLDRIQDDVAQRYIILPVHPFDHRDNNRKSMSDILKEVTGKRDALWSEMLDFVNTMIKQITLHGLEQSATQLRMADYGAILHLTSSLVGMNPTKMENFILDMQTEIVSENDPLFYALITLIETGSHGPDHVFTAKELHHSLGRINRKVNAAYGNVPKFIRGMRSYINNGQLHRAGVDVESIISGNTQCYQITAAIPS